MRLQGFDLNQLVCLEALLDEGSVTRAAERVHLSQSAMSTVLGQLRAHFGDQLLVRSGRKLVLTPFAKSLAGPLRELMARTRGFAALSPDGRVNTTDRLLKVIASDYSVAAFLGQAVQRAEMEMPGLKFDILPLSSAAPQLLASGEIDLLLAGETFDIGRPPNLGLFEDHFVCVTCAKYNPDPQRLTREEFLSRRHVVVRYFEHQMPFSDEVALRREGLKRERHVAVWSYLLVPHVIHGTSLIATVAQRIAEQVSQHWPLHIHAFPFPHQPVRIQAYWHPSRDEDPVVSQFVSLTRSVAASCKAGLPPMPTPCSPALPIAVRRDCKPKPHAGKTATDPRSS